jgi:Protein of unknown function (DUF1236)
MERYLFVFEVEAYPLAMFLYIVHLSCVNLIYIENRAKFALFAPTRGHDAEPARNQLFARALCPDLVIISGANMIRRVIGITAIALALAIPAIADAQGVPGGIERGAREGERAAGPVGAVVGGTIGGVVGGVAGILGVDQRPRFRSYVVEQRRPSYAYREEVRVGAVLPEAGVTYYEVPPEYGVHDYRYTVVNGRTVLVEPGTHRIVEIVE